jgi:type IV pilus assembly protein PilO
MDLKKLSAVDWNALAQGVAAQFKYLDPKEPGQWPLLPKVAAWSGVAVAAVVIGWVLVISDQENVLAAAEAVEPRLKDEYRDKLSQAVNLDGLRRQKEQVQEYVVQLEKQLPGKAEMDALLSDINQAGLGRGLQFELFKPAQVVVKDYYAELPISIKVSGRFHDIGAFAGDVANLSRIVTLHNLMIVPVAGKDATSGILSMEATARTYRYLDANEVAQARKAAASAVSKAGGAK